MAVFDFLRRDKAATPQPPTVIDKIAQKASAVAVLIQTGLATRPPSPTYDRFATEGYTQNAVAFQAINRTAEAMSSVQWEAVESGEALEVHPIISLLNRPNGRQGLSEFMQAFVGHLRIDGNAYIEGVTAGGRLRELYALRPDRMKIHKSTTGFPARYEYTVDGRSRFFDVDDQGRSDILHIRTFHPLSDWLGMSPLQPASLPIDQHNLASQWISGLLKNGAAPSGMMKMETNKELTDEQWNRLKAEIEAAHAGAMAAGRPMILQGGMDWKTTSFSPSDMGVIETKNSSAREICVALGVPPQLLGIPGDNTYSNYQEARLAFWEDTVIPLLRLFATSFNNWLAAYGYQVEVRPLLDDIPAIAEKRRAFWDMANASNDLTIDERRDLKGYAPRDSGEGDVILINSGQIALADVSLGLGDAEPEPEPEAEAIPDDDLDAEMKAVMRAVYGASPD